MARPTSRSTAHRLRGSDGQELAVELMVLLPIALFLLLLVVWCGRYTTSRARLSDVAAAAARAASLEADALAGRRAALAVVDESTLPHGCNAVSARVDIVGPADHPSSWRGASVTVAVACTVRNTSLAGVWAPGATVLVGRSTHPVDPFRAA